MKRDHGKAIVITGSTRGIGYGLAHEFLVLGCRVAVSGRRPATVEEAVRQLTSLHGTDRVFGCPCDVTVFEQVQHLWDSATSQFGKIDIWINNAGIAHPQTDFWDYSPEQIRAVVDTNLIGAMHGARVALKGMLAQGCGSLYNLEGLGSGRQRVPGLTLYSTTKSALRYLTDALVAETRGTPLVVGALRPGMVVTDLLTGQYAERPDDWESARRVFNILADRVEAVTPWLARTVLSNRRTGARISWLTTPKVMARFLMAPFGRRNLFE